MLVAVCALAACSAETIKRPSGSASTMSGDTLCYRYAYAKSDPEIKAEVKARRLDCAAMLGLENAEY
jgi:hypothetical protein